jgi:YVTN family beta-propeller protein
MIYAHTVSIFGRDGELLKTIPDSVQLSDFGYPQYPGSVKGGPVEAAFSPDGKDAYVSNYSMYGPGFAHPGDDVCSPASHFDNSFVYRIDVAGLIIDKVIPVGAVPKYLAVTPDNRYLLVSNWCSYDMSVIDTSTETEVKRIPLGPYPRGIALDPGSRIAYVAVMGSRDVAKINLADFFVDLDPQRRWRTPPLGHRPGGPVPVCHAERRRAHRQNRHCDGHRLGPGRHRFGATQHDDRPGWRIALHRQL